MEQPTTDTSINRIPFLLAPGEMAQCIRDFNWQLTPLGDMQQWPAVLRYNLQTILRGGFPMLLLWGGELTVLYNDAYRGLLGHNGKHPHILGKPAPVAFSEEWSQFAPLLKQVMDKGETVKFEDVQAPFYRNGKVEQVYWTFSYSPVYGDEDEVLGVLVVCSETTQKVARFHNLVQQTRSPFAIFKGRDLVIEEANPATLELWKAGPEVIGRPLAKVVPEMEAQGFVAILQRVFDTGETFFGNEVPGYFDRPDGTRELYYWNFEHSAYRESDGEITGIIAFAQDVTEQVLAKQKLTIAEDEMRVALEAADIGYWNFDLETNTVGCNERTQALFGLPGRKNLDLTFILSHVHEDDRQRVKDAIEQALNPASGGHYNVVYRIINAVTQQLTHLHAIGQAYFDENNKPYRFSGTVQNITQSVKADAELRRLKDQLEMSVRSGAIGTWHWDIKNDQLHWSPEQEALYGLAPGSFGGKVKDFHEFVLPEDLKALLQMEMEEFEGNEGVAYDFRIQRKDGSIRWIHSRSKLVKDADGNYESVSGINMDVTEERRAAEALRKSEEKYRGLFENMDQGFCIIEMLFDENGLGYDYRFLEYNARFEDHTGLKDAVGKTMRELVPDIEDHWPQRYGQVALTGMPVRFEEGSNVMNRWFDVFAFRFGEQEQNQVAILFTDISEKKKAEAELKQLNASLTQTANLLLLERERLNIALRSGKMGVYEWTIGEAAARWAPETYAIYGVDQNSFIPTVEAFTALIHPDDREEIWRLTKDCIERRAEFHHEYRIIHPDGTEHWVLNTSDVTEDPVTGVLRITGVAVDITERKKAEEALRQSNELFTTVINSTPDLVWCKDREGRITLGNNALFAVLGMGDPQRVIGRNADDLAPATGQADRIKANDQIVLETGCTLTADEYFGAGENERLYQTVKAPLRNTQGEIVGLVGVSRDITEQKQAEDSLRQNQQFIQSIIEAAPNLTYVYDLVNDRNNFASPQIAEILGFTEAEVQAMGASFLPSRFHPENAVLAQRHLQRLLADGKDNVYELEYRMKHKDGHWIWLFDRSRVFERNEKGEPTKVLGVATDITDRKKAEDELRQQQVFTQGIIEAAPSLTYIYDMRQTNNAFVSPQIEDILGYDKAEIAAMGDELLAILLHPDDVAATVERFGRIQSDKENTIYEVEYRMKHKDGRWIWLFDRARVFQRDENSQPVQILGVAADITQRKELEQKLAKQFEELEMVYNTAPVGLCLLDPECRFIRINEKLAEINGLPAAEHIGRTVLEIVPELAESLKPLLHTVYHTGQPVLNVEISGETKAQPGVTRYWNESWYPVKNDAGKTIAVSVVAEEITERKKADEALKESEKKFRHIIESNIIGVLFWDFDKGIVDSNDALLQMLGYTHDDLKNGLHWEAITPPQWAAADAAGKAQVLATGRHLPFEKQYLHKEGYPVDVIIGSSAFEGTGNRQGVTFVLDISDRKKSEKLLLESENRFRTLATTIPQIVWMNDAEGNLEYITQNWVDYTGQTLEEAKMHAPELIHPDDRPAVWQAWEEAFASGKEWKREYRLKNREGKYRWYAATMSPLKNEAGTILKWIGAATDIHEQKQFAERLEQVVAERTHELQRSNQDLQQFAHVASHDLKEPVRKIRTFISRLEGDPETHLSEKGMDYIGKMNRAAERMFSMIDGVLQYSSLGAQQTLSETVDLNRILQDVESDLEVTIQQKQAVIEVGKLPILNGSTVLLHQLFYNLLNNALKFSREGVQPLIKVFAMENEPASRQPGYLQIAVQDNGIGFHEKDAHRIFGTFTRLHSKDQYEGTGLGLSLCQKIAERHGGTIEAKGAEGKGALFIISLPVV